MGIVNVTPDSFSDGGEYFESRHAIEHGKQLASEGADILDIGGESTRPYATPVDVEEELRRTIPVIQALSQDVEVPISIDTSKSEVAEAAVAAGAEIVNDVTGLAGDRRMMPFVADAEVGVCAMHMQGTPQTMQIAPQYSDPVQEIKDYLAQRRDALLDCGVEQERICLDPGLGFGKSQAHNLALLANCWQFLELSCPLLVGHSRKGFLGNLLGDQARSRTNATLGATISLVQQGVQILRVHDVLAVADATKVFLACGGNYGRATNSTGDGC